MNELLSGLVAKYALLWLKAERAAQIDANLMVSRDAALEGRAHEAAAAIQGITGPPPTPDEVASATDRVLQVLRGEVRWSEAGPGDRAVWRGRLRNVERYLAHQVRHELPTSPLNLTPDEQEAARVPDPEAPPAPPPRTANVLAGTLPAQEPPGSGLYAGTFGNGFDDPRTPGPRLRGRERLGYHYYDTITVHPSRMPRTDRYRFFGVENIGNLFRSNMMAPGMIAGDNSFVMLGWSVWVETLEAMAWVADHAIFEFIVNNKPMTPRTFGRDLFLGMPLIPPYSRPIIIPVRAALGADMVYDEDPPPDLGSFDVMVTFEGLLTRSVQ